MISSLLDGEFNILTLNCIVPCHDVRNNPKNSRGQHNLTFQDRQIKTDESIVKRLGTYQRMKHLSSLIHYDLIRHIGRLPMSISSIIRRHGDAGSIVLERRILEIPIMNMLI